MGTARIANMMAKLPDLLAENFESSAVALLEPPGMGNRWAIANS